MNYFTITIMGIKLTARGYAGIAGAVAVTAIVLVYALLKTQGSCVFAEPHGPDIRHDRQVGVAPVCRGRAVAPAATEAQRSAVLKSDGYAQP